MSTYKLTLTPHDNNQNCDQSRCANGSGILECLAGLCDDLSVGNDADAQAWLAKELAEGITDLAECLDDCEDFPITARVSQMDGSGFDLKFEEA